jgi:hypothetical protein
VILNDEGFAGVVEGSVELGRDGVVSSGILNDESFIANHTFEHVWFLCCPLSDVTELFGAFLSLFRRVRR